MNCTIDYRIDGQPGHVVIEADSGIDPLLMWLETLQPSAGVKAIVRVLKPGEMQ